MGCAPEEEPLQRACNGAPELCDRPVNEVAFLKTHNSHASEERGFHPAAMNHFLAIPKQLDLGVRSLNVDVYFEDDALITCHGFCGLGNQPFDGVLDEVHGFLLDNRDQIVLLDFQDEAGDGRIVDAIAAHPIADLAHAHSETWPTLGELADSPLILLGNRSEGDPAWFNDSADLAYRTGWAYETPEELDCEPADPVVDGGLYEIVHVLTNPLASPDNARAINGKAQVTEHVDRCVAEVGFVNQVSVDYVSIGDALGAIDALNGIDRDVQ